MKNNNQYRMILSLALYTKCSQEFYKANFYRLQNSYSGQIQANLPNHVKPGTHTHGDVLHIQSNGFYRSEYIVETAPSITGFANV